ncbi:MAG TPA: glycoside hydrolase family 78 protein [Flavisolibacter sp.]|jgi:alpha-L-rhamnosidase|nr:glycoside hydrolase family 78 protein [Flavisolibacter sp.]
MLRLLPKRVVCSYFLLQSLGFSIVCFGSPVITITGLQCEHLINPLGIDAQNPRFTWKLTTTEQGINQGAYRLYVGPDSMGVATGKSVQWESGKINATYNLATYSGKSLSPYTKYYWRVELWDQNKKALGSSGIASFETGLLEKKNWKGSWISDDHSIRVKPAPYFRKIFETGKKIKSARAYIVAAGLYELYINGRKVGNHRLDPMYTRFDRRNLYVTYDVTDALQAGKNAIGVLLGNGWYNHQSTAVWNFHNAPWRNRPAFCLDLRILYDDGSVETISTGKGWKTALSPILFNSIYTAEHFDARLQQEGWNTTAYNDSSWKDVIYRTAPSTNIVAQAMHPVRNVEEIPAVGVQKFHDTVYVFDLGRNISGVSRLKVSGERGTTVRLKHGERLYKNGRVDQSNIDVHYRPTDSLDPFQTDIFILSGKGEESFMPLFNYKGFQYVEVVSSKPINLNKESLAGYFMHSDVPPVGQISSSNPTLNKIWWATNNSYLSNLFGYPTDCPQREKNGWTGDAHLAMETGLYNFDAFTIYEKWMADHRDEQQPNGVLPSIIPTGGWGYEWGNGPDWTSTIAVIPWNLYLFYGDQKPLRDNYENIKRYVDHINESYPSGLTSWGLGDWIPIKSKAEVELTSTAYYYTDVTILAKAAKLLGKTEDATKYSQLAEKIRAVFNKKYFDPASGLYGKGIQTELSVPLHLGLVPKQYEAIVAANLAKRIQADGNQLDVGLLGTKSILNALSDHGYGDVAYKLAVREEYPSWGWWIKNGATTLYENWPIDAKSDISMNHIMFGEIGAWFYKGLGGIKPDEQSPGFKHVILEPNFPGELNQFEAVHEGPYGRIVSAWSKKEEGISWQVRIPPNSTATIRLPKKTILLNGKRIQNNHAFKLESGQYLFTILHK